MQSGAYQPYSYAVSSSSSVCKPLSQRSRGGLCIGGGVCPPPPPPPPPQGAPERGFFNDLLGRLHLSDLDAGDLLLLFLLFYLSKQKADEELLIAIGLLLIL